MQLEGKTLDCYALDRELGRGGMGAVYHATSLSEGVAGPAGSVVAVKVFHPHLVADPRTFERFRREAEIGQSIRHENVVRTYGAGECEVAGEPCHYMVMEYVEGQTLDGLRVELGTLPDHLLFLVADQALAGLSAIHERGIVHRDIKPENIVITSGHKVLLMDLGVARLVAHGRTLTQQGDFVGSLPYAAPEQFGAFDEIGPTSDLYAFGIVLYELATGRNPFDTQDVATLLQQKLFGDVERAKTVHPELDAFWDEVIATCVIREPTRRFATADELRGILQEGEQGEWWRSRSEGLALPGAERALKRLRMVRETPLVGRENELGTLHAAYRKAQGGEGRVLLMGGSSGIGKSRLAYGFVEELSSTSGPLVLAGRSVGRGGRAYQPFVEALHDLLAIDEMETQGRRGKVEAELTRLLPDMPGVVPKLAEFLIAGLSAEDSAGLPKDALLSSIASLLRSAAAERPLILVLEDLQRSGSETLDLFGYLARCVPGHRILLVGTYEEDESEEHAELQRLLSSLTSREDVIRLGLAPLRRAASDEIVRAVVAYEPTVQAIGNTLFEKSDGNPYVLLEILTHLRGTGAFEEREEGLVLARDLGEIELPATVTELLALRLDRLDDEQRETLEAASILGQEFEASLLAAVLEERRITLLKRLAVLERKHRLLRSSGKDSFSFAQQQICEALYQGIAPALREEYHSIAADAILKLNEGEEPLAGAVAFDLVRHLLLAERADEVEPWAVAACSHAVGNYHATQTCPFLERVAGAVEQGDARVRFAVRRRQWDCYEALGRRTEQSTVLEEALELARGLADPALKAQVHCLLGVTLWRTGSYEAARAQAERALELAREAGDREWEANALHALGAIVRQLGDYAACADYWRQALAIRREIGDRHGEARSLASLGTVMPEVGESAQALETKESALAMFRELGNRRGECALLNNIGNTLIAERRVAEASERFQQAVDIARELGDLAAEGHPMCNLGRAYVELGSARLAKDALARALALFREAGIRSGVLDALRAQADALVTFGDMDGAREALEEGLELAEATGSKPVQCEFETRLAMVLHRGGRREEAWEAFERALALADELKSDGRRYEVQREMGLAALAEQDFDRAATLLEAAHTTAEGARLGGVDLVLSRVRLGRAHQLAGRSEEAQRWGRAAEELLEHGVDVSSDTGPEIYFSLTTIFGREGRGARYLDRAREQVATQSGRIQDKALRDYYLNQTWPAREIVAEDRRTFGR